MRLNRLQGVVLAVMLLMVGSFVVNNLMPVAHAQSATTGAIGGAVKDPSGAVVPNATVTITNTGTNGTQVVKTNAEGRFTASQLAPGIYKVSATAANLQSSSTQLEVLVGTTATADINVSPSGKKETVEVTASTLPLVDTQNVALVSTFNEAQIQDLPAPGGDVTTVAFTAPGVVVNAGGSYGNFSSNGLPGISNLFVLNGFDNQDPFLNLNNSGSSNLTLGQGELAEATVVENGYNSQYGRAAGALLYYTTKSGTNAFHGMADYNYNGTLLNANGWFNQYDEQQVGAALSRPHAVSNEWAANIGGPIIKDKVFFFGDYEGLHYVLPAGSGLVNLPSKDLEAYMVANVPANAANTYSQIINAFSKSPVNATAIPVTNGGGAAQDGNGLLGCGDMAGAVDPLGGYLGAVPSGGEGTAHPCMNVGTASVNNINIEWLFTGRLDWTINDKHRIYGRYKMDRGSQPTSTSVIDPLFSAVSIQPEYEGQFNDSYTFSPTKTNVFVMAANWYSAYFGPVNTAASYAELPIDFYYSDYGIDGSGVNQSPGLPGFGVPFYLTQGRNVTQYQFEDDFSWIHGKHTIKFGANFRRDLVSDYDQQVETVFGYTVLLDLGTIANGSLTSTLPFGYNSYNQAYTTQKTAHLALYNLGVYAQDEWQATSKLKMTLGIRVDRTGNPLCSGNCFSNYLAGTFPSSGASLTQPYSAASGGSISAANAHPFPSVELFNFQPRAGFNYSINEKTAVRGGVGLFSDLYPAGFVDGVIQNFPNYNAVTAFSGNIAPSGAGTMGGNTAAANSVVQTAFTSGGNITSINGTLNEAGVPFTPPTVNAYFPGKFKVPMYLEYNLQIQRELNKNTAVIINYTGNYGYHEVIQNQLLNASDNTWNQGAGAWEIGPSGSFAGLDAQPIDPSFTRVTSYSNAAHSNYNGVWISVKTSGHGLTGQVSYTYSHAMDVISNGGTGEYYNVGAALYQLTPNMLQNNLNYSNADYDIRNNLTADLVYVETYKNHNFLLNSFLGGWTVSMKTYYRSGQPFSIYNSTLANGGYTNLGSEFMGQKMPGYTTGTLTNTSISDPHSAVKAPSLNGLEYYGGSNAAGTVFNPLQNSFGDIRRNSLYGPHYANTDLSVMKTLYKHEAINFEIGANAYNVFNHTNFGQPNSTVTANMSNFGLIQNTLAPPTSPYGSFQGAAVTQRVLQVHGKIIF